MEPIEFLRQYPPFDQLTPAELTQVEAQVEVVRFARGTPILRTLDPPSSYLYVVQSGAVSLLDHGRVHQVVEEGESFGYSSLISRTAPGYDVVAASDVVVYRLAEPLFRQLLDNVAFAEYFLKSLVDRLRRTAVQQAPAPERSLATPIKYLAAGPPLLIEESATVQTAAQRMHEARVSSILVQADPPGILTDRDLRGRVLAAGLGAETPVRQVMSRRCGRWIPMCRSMRRCNTCWKRISTIWRWSKKARW
ncbi:MAG: cyclic nucleotide-binding domain-containing protein [Caldilineaceae bacterium]